MTHDNGGQVWVGEEDETMKEGLKERGKNVVNKRITKAKEAENVVVLYKILMKDTSIMFEEQRKKYEITCSYILYNFSN